MMHTKLIHADRVKNYFSSLLRDADLKATPRRIELLMILKAAKRPMTIKEIYPLTRRKLNQTTIYRAMNELTRAGIVREVNFRHNHAHFELADTRDHHHIICTKCDAVEDIKKCEARSIEKSALKNSRVFKMITSHSFELFGLCKACA